MESVAFPLTNPKESKMTGKSATDEDLLQAAISGDSDSFSIIVRRWEKKIYSICYGILTNHSDALDAAQETFISAFKSMGSFRGEAKVSSWLHRIAVNQCLTKIRRTKVRPETAIPDESNESDKFLTDLRNSPLIDLERKEKVLRVRTAVRSLPHDLRQVVVLKEIQELTFNEISKILGIPISTVKSRLYNALRQLKLKLENKSNS